MVAIGVSLRSDKNRDCTSGGALSILRAASYSNKALDRLIERIHRCATTAARRNKSEKKRHNLHKFKYLHLFFQKKKKYQFLLAWKIVFAIYNFLYKL